jgi:hypothetical protein
MWSASDKEAWKAQCRENARNLETEITRLQSDYTDLLGLFWRRYDEFWAHVRRISTMFKKPLFREDRERLWAFFLCGRFAERGQEIRPRSRIPQGNKKLFSEKFLGKNKRRKITSEVLHPDGVI